MYMYEYFFIFTADSENLNGCSVELVNNETLNWLI